MSAAQNGTSIGSGGMVTDDAAFEAWCAPAPVSAGSVRVVAGRAVVCKQPAKSREVVVGQFRIIRGRFGENDGMAWGVWHAHGCPVTGGQAVVWHTRSQRDAVAVAKAYTEMGVKNSREYSAAARLAAVRTR